MSRPRRYRLTISDCDTWEMQEHPSGEYILYQDHLTYSGQATAPAFGLKTHRKHNEPTEYLFPVYPFPATEDGIKRFGHPYAYSAGLRDFVRAKDPETAILILTLLNEGLVFGYWQKDAAAD